jgi:hypothetical protein
MWVGGVFRGVPASSHRIKGALWFIGEQLAALRQIHRELHVKCRMPKSGPARIVELVHDFADAGTLEYFGVTCVCDQQPGSLLFARYLSEPETARGCPAADFASPPPFRGERDDRSGTWMPRAPPRPLRQAVSVPDAQQSCAATPRASGHAAFGRGPGPVIIDASDERRQLCREMRGIVRRQPITQGKQHSAEGRGRSAAHQGRSGQRFP